MNVFDDERTVIADKLAAAGVAYVTLDPRAGPPCVLVGLPTRGGQPAIGIGAWPCMFTIEIVGTPPGDADAVSWMLDQLETVLTVLPADDYAPSTVTRGDVELPAYVVTVNRPVSNPNC